MKDPATDKRLGEVSFAEAVKVWLRIGLLSFGGPAGQIALMHRELIEQRRWISEPRFLHALNFCMMLPGPEAQQLATYIGWLMHGVRGGIVAGTLFVLPGFFVILALSTVYALYGSVPLVAALFFGLKAAVLAVVVEALVRIGRRALKNRLLQALAAVAFLAIFALHVPFPLIILAAGVLGYLGVRAGVPGLAVGAHDADADDLNGRVGSGGWKRAATILVVCGLLWAVPVMVLASIFGAGSVYAAVGVFFSKMAVVTFGGAYAVLSYVAQAAVENYNWLNAGEMLDGLAIAETTPGPLILVLTYVGFLAGFRDPAGLAPLAGGFLAATLTTWVTFVPCFLFVLLLAPAMERLRRNPALSGALAAITAAVVGVILNLAVWFAMHVLFARVGEIGLGPFSPAWPDLSTLDWRAALLAAVAVVALFVVRIGMVPTLAISAAGGLALHAAGF